MFVFCIRTATKLRLMEQACGCSTVQSGGGLKVRDHLCKFLSQCADNTVSCKIVIFSFCIVSFLFDDAFNHSHWIASLTLFSSAFALKSQLVATSVPAWWALGKGDVIQAVTVHDERTKPACDAARKQVLVNLGYTRFNICDDETWKDRIKCPPKTCLDYLDTHTSTTQSGSSRGERADDVHGKTRVTATIIHTA